VISSVVFGIVFLDGWESQGFNPHDIGEHGLQFDGFHEFRKDIKFLS